MRGQIPPVRLLVRVIVPRDPIRLGVEEQWLLHRNDGPSRDRGRARGSPQLKFRVGTPGR